MKRDWELIRELLTKVEACTLPTEQVHLSHFEAEQQAAVSYHMELLIEAGLVDGSMSRTMGPNITRFVVRRLTWDGHEFLESIRSESIWSKTKSTLSENGISMTFDLIKEVAKEAGAALIKGALGGG
jgi:hypothetical protein